MSRRVSKATVAKARPGPPQFRPFSVSNLKLLQPFGSHGRKITHTPTWENTCGTHTVYDSHTEKLALIHRYIIDSARPLSALQPCPAHIKITLQQPIVNPGDPIMAQIKSLLDSTQPTLVSNDGGVACLEIISDVAPLSPSVQPGITNVSMESKPPSTSWSQEVINSLLKSQDTQVFAITGHIIPTQPPRTREGSSAPFESKSAREKKHNKLARLAAGLKIVYGPIIPRAAPKRIRRVHIQFTSSSSRLHNQRVIISQPHLKVSHPDIDNVCTTVLNFLNHHYIDMSQPLYLTAEKRYHRHNGATKNLKHIHDYKNVIKNYSEGALVYLSTVDSFKE